MKSSIKLFAISSALLLAGCSLFQDLPGLAAFAAAPSDRFIVDVSTIDAGHPFKGRRANQPHQGAHVHWDNTSNAWPQGGVVAPQNYPAIYAAVDGVIDRIEWSYTVGANQRYGIDLSFAKEGLSVYDLCYSIEPMIPEPSSGFYRQYIMVTEGQKVKKGDVIASMYLPPGAGIGSHIHFHVRKDNVESFMAPAIFTPAVVDAFSARWDGFGFDGAAPIPSCMGWMLDADENPYGTAVDALK